MSDYSLSIRALRALQDVIEYRRDDAGDDAARRLEQRLYETFALVASHPLAGSRRPDLTTRKTYRFWIVENYWVVYRPRRTAPAAIVTIIDARRDVLRVLG